MRLYFHTSRGQIHHRSVTDRHDSKSLQTLSWERNKQPLCIRRRYQMYSDIIPNEPCKWSILSVMLLMSRHHSWNDPYRERVVRLLSGTLDFTVSLLWLLVGRRDTEVWLLPGLDWPLNPPVVRLRFRGTFRACSAVARKCSKVHFIS